VLVRVRACGICGSDVHGLDGRTGRRIPPLVIGHEAAGEVVECGGNVADLKPGDRVTFDSTVYCGRRLSCAPIPDRGSRVAGNQTTVTRTYHVLELKK